MSAEQWYYSRGGERQGPVAEDAIRAMAAAGTLDPNDYVWRDGMADWAPASSIPGLFAVAPVAPHMMPQAAIQGAPLNYASPVPPNYYGGYQYGPAYAGFWLRFVAVIIDGILVGIVNFVLGFVVGLIVGGVMGSSGSSQADIVLAAQICGFAVGLITEWLYFALMESSSSQATLGKMALSLKVTDLQGQRISFGRATGRHFGKIISWLICSIGYMMAGWTERKQALHDSMASCLVVRKS
jgi:uncharacterized RDD family membrane protein YckC